MTRSDRPTRHVIRDVAQLKAIRSPNAFKIVTAMEQLGPCSVGDVAKHLGQPAESLYYHVHKLVRAGLLIAQSKRSTSRREETVYRLLADQITVDRHTRTPEFLAALGGVYRSALNAAGRHLEDALKVEAGSEGPRKATDVRQQTVHLSDGDADELRRRLDELTAFLAERDDPRAPHGFSLTTALARTTASDYPS